ncbi:MAG TPA: hypothetical protein VL485_31725 [Ktedonobacteraceae bacterium]|nr:hypothetical protein [Ktedonobacteraceae bacterium]
METLTDVRRSIVEQLPLFLQLRRRTWTGFQIYIDESHLTRPAFSLLRALEGETVRGQTLTLQQMQKDLFNPYATRFTVFDHLPSLIEQGYLQQWDDGYLVTDAGRMLTDQVEMAARSYLGSLQVSPSLPLPELAAALMERVHHAWQAPEPLVKAHQARTQRRLPVEGAPAMVQVEWALLGLWEARDDAHMAAWRAYQFSGPVFDILSRIWSKKARTLPDLISTLAETQQPADVQQGILELTESGYVIATGEYFELTSQGQKVRDDIEDETDRIFFASWEQMADDKVMWLNTQISNVCAYFRELVTSDTR